MRCLLCDSTTEMGIAVCDSCADAALISDWYTDVQNDGTLRLLLRNEGFALLKGETFDVMVSGSTLQERVGVIEENEQNYREVCRLLNALLASCGQEEGKEGVFVPPDYVQLKPVIKKVEEMEKKFPGKGLQETYKRLSMLYSSAAASSDMPLCSKEFNEKKRKALAEKASFWSSLLLNVGIEHAEEVNNKEKEDESKADYSENAHEGGTELIVEAVKEPYFVTSMRMRATVHYYSEEYAEALNELTKLRASGFARKKDLEMLCICALATSRREVLDTLLFETTDGFRPEVFQAILLWRKEMWGRAIQQLDREIEESGSRAALVLKKMLCNQYELKEKEREIRNTERLLGKLTEGVNLIASAYLSMQMWGAALQCIHFLPPEDRDAETWLVYGIAMSKKDAASAMDAFGKALEMDSSFDPARLRLAICLAENRNIDAAIVQLKDCRSLMPSVLRLIAKEMDERKDTVGALECLVELLKSDPDDAAAAKLGMQISEGAGSTEMRKIMSAYLRRASDER
ncbi:MAG: tetratricopeptide repeat protein [Methanomassiliicoccales archaeon]